MDNIGEYLAKYKDVHNDEIKSIYFSQKMESPELELTVDLKNGDKIHEYVEVGEIETYGIGSLLKHLDDAYKKYWETRAKGFPDPEPDPEMSLKSANSEFDPVTRPSHYAEGRKYEPRKVIHDWGLNFNLGNAVKYISRAGRKNDALEDLKKARQYLDFEIEEMEKGE